MATSGTNVFENSFPIDEVFEEAYERVGMRDIILRQQEDLLT